MAYADYLHCAVCDTKAIYDAYVDYENARASQIAVLCPKCAVHHRLVVRGAAGDYTELPLQDYLLPPDCGG